MPDSGKFLILHSNHMASAPAEPVWDDEFSAEEALTELVYIIRQNGQDPTTQLAGYLIAEDPTYLPEGGSTPVISRTAWDGTNFSAPWWRGTWTP